MATQGTVGTVLVDPQSRSVGDETCIEIALSIAVSRQEAPKLHSLGRRCGSAPGSLDLAAVEQQPNRPARHRVQRRRTRNENSCMTKRKVASHLDLSNLDLTHSEVNATTVGLNQSGVTPEGLCHITRALTSVRLSNATSLTELHLAYNRVGDDGVASIAWAAMEGALRKLSRLVLTGNRLTQLSNLATAFSAGELPALKIMYLSSNRIGGEALADLAAATDDETGVSALHGLSQLWIDRNVIGMEDSAGDTDTEGVGISATRAIARACPGLAVLDVSGNNLRDTHLRALADAIAEGGAFSTRHIESSGPARLRVSLNTFSLAGIRHLEGVCEGHGVRLVA